MADKVEAKEAVPFEYPKYVENAEGVRVIVQDAAEEAEVTSGVKAEKKDDKSEKAPGWGKP